MSDAHLDQLLREYLEAAAEARADGITLPSLYRLVERIANRQLATEQRVVEVHRRLRANERETERLSQLAEGPDWKAETTGVHDVRALKAQLDRDEERRHNSIVWWRRKRVEWSIAALGALAIVIVTAAVTVVTTRATSAPPASQVAK